MVRIKKLKAFKKWSVTALVSTYLLIFIGGLVRVSGAGLGCPDWPKCFGRWIPPTNINQLPPDMDPSLFNFTLAWIEYVNRLMGMFVGIAIAITAILAIRYMRKHKTILFTSVAAALLVAYQGWQGSQVVASALEPFIITIHLFIALVIVSLLIYVVQQTAYLQIERKAPVNGKNPKTIVSGLYLLVLLQIVFGTQMRSQLERLRETAPMLSEGQWLEKLGPLGDVHIYLGVLVTLAFVYVFWRYGKNALLADALQKKLTILSLLFFTAQLLVGFALYEIGLPPFLQVLHLWLASLVMGTLLVLYFDLKRTDTVHE